MPSFPISPEFATIESLVLDLTRGNQVYNVYLGLIGAWGRAAEISLSNTPDFVEAKRIYDTTLALLESGDYDLHLFPPDIAGLAQKVR